MGFWAGLHQGMLLGSLIFWTHYLWKLVVSVVSIVLHLIRGFFQCFATMQQCFAWFSKKNIIQNHKICKMGLKGNSRSAYQFNQNTRLLAYQYNQNIRISECQNSEYWNSRVGLGGGLGILLEYSFFSHFTCVIQKIPQLLSTMRVSFTRQNCYLWGRRQEKIRSRNPQCTSEHIDYEL